MPKRNTGPRLIWLDRRQAFYVQWYENGQQRLRATGTADSKQAQDAFTRIIHQLKPIGHDPVLADILNLYGQEHAPHTKDPARIAYAMEALLPFWGEKRCEDITRQSCRDYVKFRAPRAPGTIRRELATLQAALNHAFNERHIASVPRVELPSTPRGRDRWLTRSEAARLLNAARTARGDVRLYLPLFIVMALYTGQRRDAILSLRWSQVDLDNRLIYFMVDGTIETNKRRGTLRIPNRLYTFLALARRRGTPNGFVIHDKGRRILDIGDSKHGSFGTACKRAGLRDVSPHVLRHTCGTWLAQRGVPLHEISGWLMHSDVRTTQGYAHHHPDYQETARRALDRR